MRQVIILILIALGAVLLTSCEKDECNCERLEYELQTYIYTDANGLLRTGIETVLLGRENTYCQDESTKNYPVSGSNFWFDIECN